MSTLVTVLHVIVCLFLVLTVLLQSGKGGGMGGAFGGGNAATVFGGGGASTFLKRMTAAAGTIFMVTSMILAFIASHNGADALEKYGDDQQKIADAKDAARKKALDAGSGSGSAGAVVPSVPTTPLTPAMAPTSGSALDVEPANGSQGGASGTATTPAEAPIPAGIGGNDVKPNPNTPAGMSATPGSEPVTAPTTPTVKPPAAPAVPAVPAVKDTSTPKDRTPGGDTAPPADSTPNAPKPN